MSSRFRVSTQGFLAITAIILFSVTAQARVARLTLDELQERADRIIIGTVIDKGAWSPDTNTTWTHYSVRVDRTIKGEADPELTIRFAGAAGEGFATGVANLPVLEVDSKYLLFLHPAAENYASATVGWKQGAFKVIRVDDREVYLSLDGEPLVVGKKGELERGTAVRYVDGKLAPYSTSRRDARSVEESEPLVTDWRGEVLEQPKLSERKTSEPEPVEYAGEGDVLEFFGHHTDRPESAHE